MKPLVLVTAALALVSLVLPWSTLVLPDSPAATPPAEDPKEEDRDDSSAADPSRQTLETRFRELLSHATFAGKWRLVEDGEIGAERTDRYTLGEVRKVEGDRWIIEARIQYGEKDVTVPVPVDVLWAGDTPVISVTDLWLPGLGKYTARVMVYRDLYTGTWFAPDHGGLMSGRIISAQEPARGADRDGGAGEDTR